MGGGLIQLAAYGKEDMFLTTDPQITFFKMIYRRHTNFTKEQIRNNFTTPDPNFGKNMNSTIAKVGDLIGNTYIVIRLPKINLPSGSRTTFAWVKKVGFALIKSVSVIISGHQIDKHYGDWLNVWAELTGEFSGPHQRGYRKMIGDIKELTDFTHTKEEYTLYIPLQFWFCRISGLVLPLVSLQYSDVKINVEFETAQNCYILSPDYYITMQDDMVGYIKNEYIEQNINGNIRGGIFLDFDVTTKRLYYQKITNDKLISIPIPTGFDTSNTAMVASLEASSFGQQYLIVGKTSNFSAFPQLKGTSVRASIPNINNLKFVDAFLLIDYYYLDDDERVRFSQTRHDYLIEQLYYTPSIEIDDIHRNIKLVADNPCKLMVWTVQMKYIFDSKDYYNYTTDAIPFDGRTPESLVLESTILLNGNERLTLRNNKYFEYVQQYQHTIFSPQVGINSYSYALYPYAPVQPSGTFNTSQIDNIEIQLKLSNLITSQTPGLFRGYCLCQNIFRIVNGLGGLVFTHD
jgi:hypothetical protein